MTQDAHTTDIVIIGAGPAGLFAVFECGMLRMRCHVVDTLDFPGGQCAALYPEKPIYDIPGHPAIDAGALVEKLEAQAAPFKPVYHLGQQVVAVKNRESGIANREARQVGRAEPSAMSLVSDSMSRSGDKDKTWIVTTSKGTEISCKAIIIAAGCGAFGPNRPPLDGLEQYERSGGVAYMVRRREDYRGKRIVIAGGGDSAVDWILSLAEVAARVSVVHRRPKFRCAPENEVKLLQLAAEKKIDLYIPYQLDALKGGNGKLAAVVVKDLDGQTKEIQADALLPFYGLAMELGPIAEWGLHLDKKHIAVDPATCATSAPGIFAIGDICAYPGKLKLILCGFSEAAMAAHAIRPLVHPGEALHFEYSTTKGVPNPLMP